MSATVLITDYGFPNVDVEKTVIESAGFQLRTAQCRAPADVISAAGDAEVLLVQWAPITAAVITALPRVRAIVRYGIGVDNVDLATARTRGVPVCNVPDYCIDEVADHTVALALALVRQLPQTHARTLAGEWSIVPPQPVPAFADITYGCAGFGRIARAVLSRMRNFGCRLAAYDPFVPASSFADAGVEYLSQDQLFERADLLSLHLPLTAETRHLVNGNRLQRMKRSAILINTSRGALIDTTALAAAVDGGRLAGAGLDVYESEPLPADHPLRHARNVLLTSHTAWFSNASVPRLQRLAAMEAVRALRGDALRNVVTAG